MGGKVWFGVESKSFQIFVEEFRGEVRQKSWREVEASPDTLRLGRRVFLGR